MLAVAAVETNPTVGAVSHMQSYLAVRPHEKHSASHFCPCKTCQHAPIQTSALMLSLSFDHASTQRHARPTLHDPPHPIHPKEP